MVNTYSLCKPSCLIPHDDSFFRSDASVFPHQDATYNGVSAGSATSKLQSTAFPAASITTQYFRIASPVLR